MSRVTFDGEPPAGTINLGIGQPSRDLLPTDLLRRASEAFFAEAHPNDLNYGNRQGDQRFLSSLATYLTHGYGTAVDPERFPAVDLARAAVRAGKGAPTVLNCANEGAVAAFLAGQCRFLDISWVVETALEGFLSGPMAGQDCHDLEAILAVEAEAKRLTGALLDEVKCQMQERTA